MKIEGQTAWVTGGGSGLGGLFETPLMKQLSEAVQQSLAASTRFRPGSAVLTSSRPWPPTSSATST